MLILRFWGSEGVPLFYFLTNVIKKDIENKILYIIINKSKKGNLVNEDRIKTMNYQRTIDELKHYASFFWPSELSNRASKMSIIPRLIQTQDQFLAILSIDISALDAFFRILESSNLSPNFFLKHLVVLSDFGGEMLQRVNSNFVSLFPSGEMNFYWKEKKYSYSFKALPIAGRHTNSKLGISGKRLNIPIDLNDLIRDVIVILLFGSVCINSETADILSKCEISDYIGKPDELAKFVKQRYIWVSRITTGVTTNTLGQEAQKFVTEFLEKEFGSRGVIVRQNSGIDGISHTSKGDSRLTNFDIVATFNEKNVAI